MKQIGRYEVSGELGRGAMGIVYEATDPLIGRQVAIKTIRLTNIDDAQEAEFLRERLFREARSAGALFHPGIVIVFDVGQQDETAFIAMEKVDGPSLYQVLAEKKLTQAEVFDILRQTASALDYAHQNGVIHRDIKPANIMLHKGTTVKVADFGIAKINSGVNKTRTGMMMGTPSYMSPEQINSVGVDGRSDQFALAVVAYEMLTGTRPFASDSLATLVHMIVFRDRPSARASNPNLPPAVDAVFNRGLAVLPKDRYTTCAEFVAALETAVTGYAMPFDPRATPVPQPHQYAPQPLMDDEGLAPTRAVMQSPMPQTPLPQYHQPAPDPQQPYLPPVGTPMPQPSPLMQQQAPVQQPVIPHPQAYAGGPMQNSPQYANPQQFAPQPQYTGPGTVPPKKSGSPMGLIIGGIVLVVLAVGGYFVYQQYGPQILSLLHLGGGGGGDEPAVTSVPVIGQFVANPDPQTKVTTLRWDVGLSKDVSIDQGIGKVEASGTKDVTPAVATTYTLTATNKLGAVTAQVKVDPPAAGGGTTPAGGGTKGGMPRVVTFHNEPRAVKAGEEFRIIWKIIGDPDTVEIDNGVGAVAAEGSKTLTIQDKTTYTLTAVGKGGTVKQGLIVNIATAAKNDAPAKNAKPAKK